MNLSFEEFENQLGQVLHRLYDPSLLPPDLFWQVLGLSPNEGLNALQTALIQAVEDMRPAEHVPKSARGWRYYAALYYRFIANLSQDEVADIVSITPRHLRREQASAINLLARRLWSSAALPLGTAELKAERDDPAAETPAPEEAAPPNPEAQLRLDLQALQESAPGIIADVPQVVRNVVAMLEKYPASGSCVIRQELAAELKAGLHPSALRQVLWMIVRQALERENASEIVIQSGSLAQRAWIELSFSPPLDLAEARVQTIREILALQNGILQISRFAAKAVYRVDLLLVDRTVLVVDDNPDIVHLYQRFLVGTPYSLIHTARGQEAIEQIHSHRPDIIVLDVMLPDIDGWDLLTRLSELTETRAIPVIICSVVSDPELAAALGARLSLSKPVQRSAFLAALNQAARRSSE